MLEAAVVQVYILRKLLTLNMKQININDLLFCNFFFFVQVQAMILYI